MKLASGATRKWQTTVQKKHATTRTSLIIVVGQDSKRLRTTALADCSTGCINISLLKDHLFKRKIQPLQNFCCSIPVSNTIVNI